MDISNFPCELCENLAAFVVKIPADFIPGCPAESARTQLTEKQLNEIIFKK